MGVAIAETKPAMSTTVISREDAASPDVMEGLIARWLGLGEVERRAFLAMAEELSASSDMVENSTLDLTRRFRDLASGAATQASLAQRVADIARHVNVAGEDVTMPEATAIVEAALHEAIGALGRVSAQAMTMVKALDAVLQDVVDAEACVARINTINIQARFVALNAAIEANRAATSGGTFKVIAHELKALSQETDSTAQLVKARITSIATAVRAAHHQLRGIAVVDRAHQDRTQTRLSAVMEGMIHQNQAMTDALSETQQQVEGMSETIARLITGAQFQDRTTQHLNHVIDALGVLGDIKQQIRNDSRSAVPALRDYDGVDDALIARILGRQTLSSVRGNFAARLADRASDVPPTNAAEAGDIELF